MSSLISFMKSPHTLYGTISRSDIIASQNMKTLDLTSATHCNPKLEPS